MRCDDLRRRGARFTPSAAGWCTCWEGGGSGGAGGGRATSTFISLRGPGSRRISSRWARADTVRRVEDDVASDAPKGDSGMRAGVPFLRSLLESPMSGEAIEALSFATIDREAPPHRFTPAQWVVVRRMIHATADFGLMENATFSVDAIDAGVAALHSGRPLFVDANMIRAGLSLARLRDVCPAYGPESIACYVAG